MKATTFIATQALLTAMSVSAQETIGKLMFYNTPDCGSNPNNPDAVSTEVLYFKDAGEIKVVNGEVVGTCMRGDFATSSAWDDSMYIDQDTIPDGCEAVFYSEPPNTGSTQGECLTFYRRVKHSSECTKIVLKAPFGSAMCCGAEACEVPTGALPLPPPKTKRDPFANPAPAPYVKDVTAVKRAPLMDRSLERRDCTFKPKTEGQKSSIIYGEQKRVSGIMDCKGSESCQLTVGLNSGQSVSNSFGVSTEFGGELFKVISASVSFSYEFSQEKSNGKSFDHTFTADANSSGYLTFQPKVQCSGEGTLSGGCESSKGDKWTEGDGSACFPVYNGEFPDGIYTWVRND